jgi:hypothetical protein
MGPIIIIDGAYKTNTAAVTYDESNFDVSLCKIKVFRIHAITKVPNGID